MECPLTMMLPRWIFSRWLRQRMKVVLPEPDGPMMTTTSWRLTVSEMPLSTSTRPKDLWTSTASTTLSTVAAAAPPMTSSRS